MSAESSIIQTESLNTHAAFTKVREHLQTRIIGQSLLVDRLLIALLADGHLLVEGAPGLAKTTAIKELSSVLEGDFHRLQFTPDLLPGDLTGSDVYRPETGEFVFQKGPLFHNLILADEINRAPAKVQSALLEAMGEHQITVGSTTYQLPLMHVFIDYPDAKAENQILQLAREQAKETYQKPSSASFQLSQSDVEKAQQAVLDIHMAEPVQEYLVQLILASRNPVSYNAELARWISYGGSPRATISLDRCARAHAWLHERDYVSPEDVQAVAFEVLRHRLLISYEAEAEGITADNVIEELIRQVPVS